ncbi:hypothetical protein uan_012 [Pseudomonas phage UAntarctica]|nr:hypothetical protein uan_012 [Pseudomonas phage UAntarctica]
MPHKKLYDGTVVKTNLIPRLTVSWHELTDAEKKDLDYLDTAQHQEDFSGFRFKNSVWDIGEFVRTEKNGALAKAGWHGVSGQSAFHGVVIHLCDDSDYVVVGQVFS